MSDCHTEIQLQPTHCEATTLGKYLDKYLKLFHSALKKALDGVYGFASDAGASNGCPNPRGLIAGFPLRLCAIRLLSVIVGYYTCDFPDG